MYGVLKEHGAAPYNFDDSENDSYFVTIELDNGKDKIMWSVGLGQAISSSKEGISLGDRVNIKFTGKSPVKLPNGKWAHRNSYEIKKADKIHPKTNNAKSVSTNKVTKTTKTSHKSSKELTIIDKFTFALVGGFFTFLVLGAMFA